MGNEMKGSDMKCFGEILVPLWSFDGSNILCEHQVLNP